MNKVYYPTHTRMGPWLVGVILGYIMSNSKNRAPLPKVKLTLFV